MCLVIVVCVCVCVLKLLRYCDAMSCLPIVSDRAATEGSKYFELGRQPHEFLTRNTCLRIIQRAKYIMFQKGEHLAAMLAVSRYNYPVLSSFE